MKRKLDNKDDDNESTKISKKELKVEIDFDDASREWLKNKRKLENGCYEYKRTRYSGNN